MASAGRASFPAPPRLWVVRLAPGACASLYLLPSAIVRIMKTRYFLVVGVPILAVTATACGSASFSARPAAAAAPAPVVVSVTPAADTTGSQVVVSGSNLTLPPGKLPDKVLFGSVEAKVNSCAPLTGAASSCNVTVPAQCAGHKVVDVRIVVGKLESAVSSGDQFTYTDSAKAPACPTSSPTSTSTSKPTATPTGTATPGSAPSSKPSRVATEIPVVPGLG